MKKHLQIAALIAAFALLTIGTAVIRVRAQLGGYSEDSPGNSWVSTPADDTVTFQGSLQVGKTDSVILYFGAESGDYAAFCFPNNSDAGRAILAACKDGEQCEFTGKVDFTAGCAVKGLEADLSASGRILSVESVKSVASEKATRRKTK